MRIETLVLLAILVSLPLFTPGLGSAAENNEKLPEGDSGIAAKYSGDKGIAKDPDVLFADDFEQSLSVSDLRKKWDVLINKANLRIVEGAGKKHGGERSLLMSIPKQKAPLATGVAKQLSNTQDILFMRWYMKFDSSWSVLNGSVHNGASISSKYFEQGQATPGVRADGSNKFLVNFEARPDFSPQKNRWYCYEYMVKANIPGKRDGRIALWVDGTLIADFPNLRLRDVDDLEIDRFGLDLYIANNMKCENRKWHDDVVVATSYIGPMNNSKNMDIYE